MSKPVRIKDYVAARVEAVASLERRSFANMVEVLLLAGLDGLAGGAAGLSPGPSAPSVSPSARVATVPEMKTKAEELALRDGRCTADTPRGLKCKLCGKVH